MRSRSKREFLAVSVAGLAAGSLTPGVLLAGQALRPDKFTTAGFRALVNTPFAIGHGQADHDALALVGVADGPSSLDTEQFSITFKGSSERALPEGLYEVRHREIGRFQLHIQPVAGGSDASYYRSAFSLIRPGFRAG